MIVGKKFRPTTVPVLHDSPTAFARWGGGGGGRGVLRIALFFLCAILVSSCLHNHSRNLRKRCGRKILALARQRIKKNAPLSDSPLQNWFLLTAAGFEREITLRRLEGL